jgi:DNA gyrase/topoisomerase IV subunit B
VTGASLPDVLPEIYDRPVDPAPTSSPSPTEVVGQLMAMSVIEHTNSHGLSIHMELGEQAATITDTGRGMKISPDDGESVSHAEKALTTPFPVVASDPVVEMALRDLVWGQQGSSGPWKANAACPELRLVSRRDGEEWAQRYVYGVPAGPAQRVGSAEGTGTILELKTDGPIDNGTIRSLADELNARIDGLDLVVIVPK